MSVCALSSGYHVAMTVSYTQGVHVMNTSHFMQPLLHFQNLRSKWDKTLG